MTNYIRVKNQRKATELMHLPHWAFKLYFFLIEISDRDENGNFDWVARPDCESFQTIGIGRSTASRAISLLKEDGLIETGNFIRITWVRSDSQKEPPVQEQRVIEVTQYKSHKKKEELIRDKVAQNLGGRVEIWTASGKIDVETEDEIIEIKPAKEWKSALGQILSYAVFLPNKKKRIHLFGVNGESKEVIEKVCSIHQVIVTYEEEN